MCPKIYLFKVLTGDLHPYTFRPHIYFLKCPVFAIQRHAKPLFTGYGMNTEVSVSGGDSRALMHIIERAAMSPEVDLERLEKLLTLKDLWEKREAVKAFNAAMVEFKKNPPTLNKDRHVKYGNTEYDHATHYEVTSKLCATLSLHGFSHAWTVAQDAGAISVTCTLSHVAGHSDGVTLQSMQDGSGGKNSIQAIASAVTYLQRYTLLAVTGMTTGDMPEHDGRPARDPDPKPDISASIWLGLEESANEGIAALEAQWNKTDNDVRKDIVVHYAKEWNELKKIAQGAKP